MIRTILRLLPAESTSTLTGHLLLSLVSVLLRAGGAVALIPLVTALFGDTPSDAWPWVGLVVLLTLGGWIVDWTVARFAFRLGFTLLDTTQRDMAERLSRTHLGWFTPDHTATARTAIAAAGPDLVGAFAYLVTPLIGAIGMPIAISLMLIPVSWQLAAAAAASIPIMLAAFFATRRISRSADRGF
ncbi:MAG: iron ABC transporter permease, partial [Microbacterium sp.]